MRDVLRARKARLPDVSRETGNDYSGLVSGISVRSIQEIDHLIDGLQGLREKLNSDGDRLHRDIVQHAAFSQSIIELTKIISDGVAVVSKSATAVAEPDALVSVSTARYSGLNRIALSKLTGLRA
jgi:hypothetical protein